MNVSPDGPGKNRGVQFDRLAQWHQALIEDVAEAMSPNEKMGAGNLRHYFGVGQSALRAIKLSLNQTLDDTGATTGTSI